MCNSRSGSSLIPPALNPGSIRKLETIRAFFAIDLPSTVRNTIAETQAQFKGLGLKISWVKPENIHLTLKFLGDVPENRIEKIRNCFFQDFGDINRFQVSLGKLGVFSNWNRPRVFWIGVRDETKKLYELWSHVQMNLEALGFAKDIKGFSPHLTLARIKSPENKDRLQQKVSRWRPFDIQPFEVCEIKLFKSRLTPQGSIYTVLETFPFRKP